MLCPGEPLPSSSSPDGSPPFFFWFVSFCLPFFWVPGWPPFLSLPSGEGSKAFCPVEEHVPCHCCMPPQPCDSVCKPSSLWGRVPRGDGTFQDRGSRGCDPGQGWGWKGGGPGRPWKLTCFHFTTGGGRIEWKALGGLADAVLKPSGWLSEVRLGGGLPITLALLPPAISRCSVNTWC